MKQELQVLEGSYFNLKQQDEIKNQNFEVFLTQNTRIIDAYDELILRKYIDFQRDTSNKKYESDLEFAQSNIKPLLKKFKEEFEKKVTLHFIQSDDVSEYDYLRTKLLNKKNLYSEDNVRICIEEDKLINRYLKITGELKSQFDENQNITELYGMLYEADETKRKRAYTDIAKAYMSKEKELNSIFTELYNLRSKKVENLNLTDFVELSFKELERLDYAPIDCRNLADSVKRLFLPLKEELQQKQIIYLKKDELSPWDSRVSPYSEINDVFSESEEQLLDTAGRILNRIDPYFYAVFDHLRKNGNFDLQPRPDKAGGGFSEFLPSSKESFVFMNMMGTFDDLVILMHEMGHTIHHDLIKDISISEYKKLPMEIAEFAAMSLELLSMEHWDLAIEDNASLYKAKLEHFRLIIEFLPQTVIVDQFQHWIYTHPSHSLEERNSFFKALVTNYDSNLINWDSVDDWKGSEWLSVLHIFESPFYYIEYAIAQIAALQLYMKYKTNPLKTVKAFKQALSMGSKLSVKEIYELAGVRFDFSDETLLPLVQFIKQEIVILEDKVGNSLKS